MSSEMLSLAVLGAIILFLGAWYWDYLAKEKQKEKEEEKEDYARACYEYKVNALKQDFRKKFKRDFTDEEYNHARRRCGSYDDTNILNWLLLYTVMDEIETTKSDSSSTSTYSDSLGFESSSYSYSPSASSYDSSDSSSSSSYSYSSSYSSSGSSSSSSSSSSCD